MRRQNYTPAQREDIAYRTSHADILGKGSAARTSLAEKYETSPSAITRIANEYWWRWHFFIDKEIKNEDFTSEESKEYKKMKDVVRRLDDEEAKRLKINSDLEKVRRRVSKRLAELTAIIDS